MKARKRLFAGFLALAMLLSLNVTAFAQYEEKDYSTLTIYKQYDSTGTENNVTASPQETFNFTVSNYAVTDAGDGVTTQTMPTPTISSVEYQLGEAGSATKTKEITIAVENGKTLKNILYVEGMNTDVLSTFTMTTVPVEGANGFTAKNYNVYRVEVPGGLTARTYKVNG